MEDESGYRICAAMILLCPGNRKQSAAKRGQEYVKRIGNIKTMGE